MSRTLVTGGAGFIGSHLVQALLERGDRVRVLDDLSTGMEENLADMDVEMIIGDIRNMETVQKAAADIDIVFHLAAQVSVPASMSDPLTCYAINLSGSMNVLWAAKLAGVQRVVLASSAAVYGETNGLVREVTPASPLSPYAAAKLGMEQAADLFGKAYDLPFVTLRYFNVYGPRQAPDSPYAAAIPIFISTMLSGEAPIIHGDGGQTRDFVFIDDVVRANLLAAECTEAVGGIFNIGGGAAVSILDLVCTLQRIIPNTPEPVYNSPRKGDIRFSQADINEAARALGYRPIIELEKGLEITVQWFRRLINHTK